MQKIKKIEIENFKLFEDKKVLDFTGKDFIVLDGPNGYGKTTIFDAIEILITGTLKRIVDTEYRGSEKEIIYANKLDKPIKIKGLFETGTGESFVIIRKSKNEASGKINKINEVFESYIADDLEERNLREINKNELLNKFGIDNKENLFHSLCYIPQQESTTFLRLNEKDRRDVINGFFDIKKEQKELKKLKKIRDSLNRTKIELLDNINNLESTLAPKNTKDIEPINYHKIIKKDIEWDRENFNTDKYPLNSILANLDRIAELKKNEDHYQNYLINKKNSIFDEKLITLYFRSYPFLNDIKEYELQNDERIDLENLLEIINAENYKKLISNPTLKFISEKAEIDFNEFEKEVNKLFEKQTFKGDLQDVIKDIISIRENLLEKYSKYKKIEKSPKESCPLCGTEFEDDIFLRNLEIKKNLFLDQMDKKDQEILLSKLKIKEYIKKIKNELLIRTNKLISVEKLTFLREGMNNKPKLDLLDDYIKVNKILLENNIPSLDIVADSKKIKNYIDKTNVILPEEFKGKEYDEVYATFFESHEELKKLTYKNILDKKEYIKSTYDSIILKNYRKKINELKKHKLDHDKIDVYYTKLKKLCEIYVTKIRKHSEEITKNLEIPLYIYSGKILQNYQNGLGVFIKTEKGLLQVLCKL